MYNNLLEIFNNLQNNIAGFRKVVLHMHSPDSFDYNNPAGITDKPTAEKLFVDAIDNSILDMVAITDHMKCELACRYSTTSGRICVLPAMEINFRPSAPWNTFKLHIIAIFPEGHTIEQMCKIFPKEIPSEGDRNGHEVVEGMDLPRFISDIHRYGGLCIAAHVDSDPRGVRHVFRQLGRDGIVHFDPNGILTKDEEEKISKEFKEWILSAGFDGIEVSKESDKEHYRWISKIGDRTVSIPVLLTNDSHCIEDIGTESRITHIKMTSICFDGLEQALKFPDTRVRFPRDVPSPSSPCILGLEIISGEQKGFFEELQIAFSNDLTCLIGPRGSGKSTIIEALRYVFGYNRTLDQIQQPGADLAKKVRELQKATLTNCIIRVVYQCRQSSEPHILEATYNPGQEYATKVYTKDREEIKVDVEGSGLYPLRLFGWSEIETLGREASRQRELLDRLIPGLFEKIEQRNELRTKLGVKRREIESALSNLLDIMNKNQGEIRRYKEYKERFEKLNTEEIKTLFAEFDIAKSKVIPLGELKTNTQSWFDTLKDTIENDIISNIEPFKEGSEALESWWTAKKVEMKVTDRQAYVRSEISKGMDVLKELINELNINIQQNEEEIQDKNKKIRDKVSDETDRQVAADLRRDEGDRLRKVGELKQEYGNQWVQFEKLIGEWIGVADNLLISHEEISIMRKKRKDEIENLLNRVGTEEMTISLRFDSGRDRDKFEIHLRDGGFLSGELHGHYKVKSWPEKIAKACSPIELAKAILTNKIEQLKKENELAENGRQGVDDDIAKSLMTTLCPFSQDEDADVPIIDRDKLKKLLATAEIEWDDLEGILLNGNPVEHLSPGQRSSAMLPLILLVGDVPLVIDQPEDNLDNRLVGKMLVNLLADLKEKRQIIVATHNPNIVVSGDAEQVIVLDALSDSKGNCDQTGSIDKEEIVKSVIDLMEGGKEAFLIRGRRYGLGPQSD